MDKVLPRSRSEADGRGDDPTSSEEDSLDEGVKSKVNFDFDRIDDHEYVFGELDEFDRQEVLDDLYMEAENSLDTYHLGLLYLYGVGCEKDVDAGIGLITEAAQDGLDEAQKISWDVITTGERSLKRIKARPSNGFRLPLNRVWMLRNIIWGFATSLDGEWSHR